MVSMMILLTVLILLSCRGGVDGRTWRPSTGTPPSILLQRNRRQPSSAAFFKTSYDTVAFLRGGETDNFQSCSPFNGLSRDGDSNCNTSGARGGSTTPQLVNTLSTIHDLSSITATSSDASISTLPSSSSSTTDLLEDSSTSSSSSFEQTKSIETVVVDHGGAYLISEEISNEVTNDKNGTAKTPSDIKAAFKELKLQRKKEKEQRKRHKQIAKSLRVGVAITVAYESSIVCHRSSRPSPHGRQILMSCCFFFLSLATLEWIESQCRKQTQEIHARYLGFAIRHPQPCHSKSHLRSCHDHSYDRYASFRAVEVPERI